MTKGDEKEETGETLSARRRADLGWREKPFFSVFRDPGKEKAPQGFVSDFPRRKKGDALMEKKREGELSLAPCSHPLRRGKGKKKTVFIYEPDAKHRLEKGEGGIVSFTLRVRKKDDDRAYPSPRGNANLLSLLP